MTTRRLATACGAVFAGAALFALGFHAARAAVPPDDAALVYSGVLEDDGALVDGTRSIGVAVFDDDVAGTLLCESGAQPVDVVRGRFKVAMPAACAGVLRGPGDAFIDVSLDGDSLGRARVAAVPFALAAGEASAATPGSALDAALAVATPSGAVVAFDLDACPPGWTELAGARGRAVVGTNPDGANGLSVRARGSAFGVERVALLIGEMPQHNHGGATGAAFPPSGGGSSGLDYTSVPGPGRGFQYLGVANPSNAYNAHVHAIGVQGGNQPHENMQPSLALLYCRRD